MAKSIIIWKNTSFGIYFAASNCAITFHKRFILVLLTYAMVSQPQGHSEFAMEPHRDGVKNVLKPKKRFFAFSNRGRKLWVSCFLSPNTKKVKKHCSGQYYLFCIISYLYITIHSLTLALVTTAEVSLATD